MRPVVVWLVVCVAATAGVAPPAWAQNSRTDAERALSPWHSLPLPVTLEELAAAAGLPAPAAPEFFLFDLIRVVHERPMDAARSTVGPLADVSSVLRSDRPGPGAVVPLPLAPDTWARVVFGRPIPRGELAAAILGDRRASLLYVGLGALDAETLAFVEGDASLLSLMARHAAVTAAFGRSVSIHDGSFRLALPPEYQPAWEALVGAAVSDPARFVPALLGRDHGRLAYFLDTLQQLDEPHQRFVMGPAAAGPIPERAKALLAAYEPFRRANPEWSADVHPFYRPPFDLVAALRVIRVVDQGALGPPASRPLWNRVFSSWMKPASAATTAPGPQDVDAPWLLSQWLASSARDAAVKVEQVRVAQRLFADQAVTDAVLERAIVAVGRYPALALALERLHATDPETHAAAAEVAAAATSRASGRDGFAALSLLQGALALIERACWAGTIDERQAKRLLGSLLEQGPSPGIDYEAALVDWLATTLLPAFGSVTGVAPAAQPERVVLAALAGIRRDAGSDTPVLVAWEGESYRLDVAAGSMDRLRRFRARVVTPSLEQALALHRATGDLQRSEAAPDVASLSSLLEGLDEVLPVARGEGDLRTAFDRARRAVARLQTDARRRQPGEGVLRDLARLRNMVAADVVRALVYLPSLGDPEGPARLGGDVARRHRFDAPDPSSAAVAAWSLPREFVTVDRGWHVRGALLGLDVGLARLALRRLDLDRIPYDPRIDDVAKRRFAVAAALARPDDVSDTIRDRVSAALAKGRARFDAAAGTPDGLAAMASAAGLDARRRNALQWAVGTLSAHPAASLSTGEIMRLGADEPLSFEVETIPDITCLAGVGACGVRLSHLGLSLLDALAARRLPAALLPSLLASASQDLLDDAQPMHGGDERAIWQWVREIRPERIDDYVAALAGSGPLVAVEPRQPTGDRR